MSNVNKKLNMGKPAIFFSGQRHDTIAKTLVNQITTPVLYEDTILYLLNDGFARFIEVGPGNILSGFLKRIRKEFARFIEVGPGNILSGFLKRIRKEVEILNVTDLVSLEKTILALKGQI